MSRVLILLTDILLISESVLSLSNQRKKPISFSRKIKPSGIGRSKHKKYLGSLIESVHVFMPSFRIHILILAYDQINQFYKALEKKHSFSEIGETIFATLHCIAKTNMMIFAILEKIGESFEGREINVFKINANNNDLPAVIMDAGN